MEDSDQTRSNLERAASWYAAVSANLCQLRFCFFTAPAPARPLAYYSCHGGKGEWPRNSQSLVCEVLQGMDATALGTIRTANGTVLVAGARDMLPHAWHIPNGGIALGGVWARRYAIVPPNASLGALVHELGHLLFDWPDFHWPHVWERDCVMARGANGDLGADPSPPCAPLLIAQGWRETIPATGDLTPAALSTNRVATLEWLGTEVLIEWRTDQGASRLLFYATPDRPVGRIPLSPEQTEKPILGLIAGELRRRLPPQRT